MKTKLTTLVHKFMDFEYKEMPEGLMEKLDARELFTYRDTVLKEHLYSIDTVQEFVQEYPHQFADTQKEIITCIRAILDKNDCGYFRFVSN